MGRTTIEIDDELIQAVMTEHNLKTKREAVDFALRRALRRTVTRDDLTALEGAGFGSTLADVRPDDTHRLP